MELTGVEEVDGLICSHTSEKALRDMIVDGRQWPVDSRMWHARICTMIGTWVEYIQGSRYRDLYRHITRVRMYSDTFIIERLSASAPLCAMESPPPTGIFNWLATIGQDLVDGGAGVQAILLAIVKHPSVPITDLLCQEQLSPWLASIESVAMAVLNRYQEDMKQSSPDQFSGYETAAVRKWIVYCGDYTLLDYFSETFREYIVADENLHQRYNQQLGRHRASYVQETTWVAASRSRELMEAMGRSVVITRDLNPTRVLQGMFKRNVDLIAGMLTSPDAVLVIGSAIKALPSNRIIEAYAAGVGDHDESSRYIATMRKIGVHAEILATLEELHDWFEQPRDSNWSGAITSYGNVLCQAMVAISSKQWDVADSIVEYIVRTHGKDLYNHPNEDLVSCHSLTYLILYTAPEYLLSNRAGAKLLRTAAMGVITRQHTLVILLQAYPGLMMPIESLRHIADHFPETEHDQSFMLTYRLLDEYIPRTVAVGTVEPAYYEYLARLIGSLGQYAPPTGWSGETALPIETLPIDCLRPIFDRLAGIWALHRWTIEIGQLADQVWDEEVGHLIVDSIDKVNASATSKHAK